ncbi:hypothetical protein GEMRC1_003247 [Eukaryota sp. GEM-RC1]
MVKFTLLDPDLLSLVIPRVLSSHCWVVSTTPNHLLLKLATLVVSPGDHEINYYRVDKRGRKTEIASARNTVKYVPTADDVTHQITVEFTPVRNDGVCGEMVTASSQTISVHPSYCDSIMAAVSQKEVIFPCVISRNSSSDFGKPGEERILLLNLEKIKIRLKSDRTLFKTAYAASIKTRCVDDNSFELLFGDSNKVVHLCSLEKSQPKDLVVLCIRAFIWLRFGRHPLTGNLIEGAPTSDKQLKKWVKNGSFLSFCNINI